MRQTPSHINLLLYHAMAVVLVIVVAVGVLTNLTLRSIEKNLPNTLLKQLRSVSDTLEMLGEATFDAELAKIEPIAPRLERLRTKMTQVHTSLIALRNSYVFDNLIQSSAFHAEVAPAVVDALAWLDEGVSGFGPQTPTTLAIVHARIRAAYEKAKAMNDGSYRLAQGVLKDQGLRLERFLVSVNILFALTLIISILMSFLLVRQRKLHAREIEAQEELRRTERSLRESEELYSKLVAAIPDMVVRTDLQGRILFVNETAAANLGCRPTELQGQSMPDFISPEDRLRFGENTHRLFEEDPGPMEYRFLLKEGDAALFEVKADVLQEADGSPFGIVYVCRDITERRRAETALRESEEKYRLLVKNANDGIFIAQDGCIKFPNPKVLKWMELPGTESGPISFLEFIHPEDRAMVTDIHRRRLSGEAGLPTNYSFRALSRSGREYVVQINAVSIAWEGRPATLNFIRDITEQRKLELHLQQVRKMEAVGTLAGGIAHDFNNLLMGIQGRVSLMLADIEPPHEHHEHLKGVEAYVKSATELTRQLLGFAKGGKYEVKPTDMNRLIAGSAEMFGRTRKEIRIFRKFREDLWTVEADRGQMHQVLLNLFVNAWQAMPGGGDLYLQTENLTIDPAIPRMDEIKPGRYIKISVTDTGVGMDHLTRARVFDPFFTTKGMGRGTGLGLASAYGIVKNHGGLIRVYSEPGQGTTFTIYLPVTEKAPAPEDGDAAPPARGTGSILLVDDEEMILEVASRMLEKLGYRAITANSGAQAVEIVRQKADEIDLIILDMIMPVMGGSETFDRIRQIDPEATVLLSSGYSLNGQAIEILQRGCHGFIQKPFSLSELSQKVKEAMEKGIPESGAGYGGGNPPLI